MKKNVFTAVNVVLGFLNLALFILWFFNLIKKEPLKAPVDIGNFADAISIQIAILGIIITVVTIVLAAGSILGYNAIKASSEEKAIEAARKVANKEMGEFISNQQGSNATYAPVTSTMSDEAQSNDNISSIEPKEELV